MISIPKTLILANPARHPAVLGSVMTPLVARNARYLRPTSSDDVGAGRPSPLLFGLLQLLVVPVERLGLLDERLAQRVVRREPVDERRSVDLKAEGHEEGAGERDHARRRREPLRRPIHRLVEPVVDLGDQVALGGVQDGHVLPRHVRDSGAERSSCIAIVRMLFSVSFGSATPLLPSALVNAATAAGESRSLPCPRPPPSAAS